MFIIYCLPSTPTPRTAREEDFIHTLETMYCSLAAFTQVCENGLECLMFYRLTEENYMQIMVSSPLLLFWRLHYL
jgi:hypothetical protein